jgi:hypothetical protein
MRNLLRLYNSLGGCKKPEIIMSECCSLSPMPERPKFTGCDGTPWSNEFLCFHLQMAVDEEKYEWANECQLELNRRGVPFTPPKPE